MKDFALTNQLFSKALLQKLKQESLLLYKNARLHYVDKTEIKERGGVPKRKYKAVGGGRIQNKIYQSDLILSRLSKLMECQVLPTGGSGTYSYYLEENDFLDIHRDVDECDLTLITCLHSNVVDSDGYGQLYLYTDRKDDAIQAIYDDRMWGYRLFNLKEGESIVIKGGKIPHGLNPLSQGSQRIISALCFRYAS